MRMAGGHRCQTKSGILGFCMRLLSSVKPLEVDDQASSAPVLPANRQSTHKLTYSDCIYISLAKYSYAKNRQDMMYARHACTDHHVTTSEVVNSLTSITRIVDVLIGVIRTC